MRPVAVAVALAVVGCVQTPAGAEEEFRSCAETQDFACMTEIMLDGMESGTFPIERNGFLTVGGANAEFLIQTLDTRMTPAGIRSLTERALSAMRREYPDTPFVYSSLHLERIEACDQLGDDACVEESIASVCRNATSWMVPKSRPPGNMELADRLSSFTNACVGR